MTICEIIGCTDRADEKVSTPHGDELWYCRRHSNYMQNSTGKKEGYEVVRRA
jgi:hypothetical protein